MSSPARPHKPNPPSDAIRVWLVDDNLSFRTAVARVINGVPGIECSGSFTSSEDTIDALHAGQVPDVILLDVNLPGQSGLEALHTLKALAPDVQVVILTVFDDAEKIYESVRMGASGYLLKTSTPQQIIEAIHEVRAGGSPMNPRVTRTVMDLLAKMTAPLTQNKLTERERDVLRLMCQGLSTKQIADTLKLSYHTIDTHVRNIYTKLKVHSRSEAVARALNDRMF
jgi:DNA-binding NarL/FixJ family response regulator